jgi:hypothetical protein
MRPLVLSVRNERGFMPRRLAASTSEYIGSMTSSAMADLDAVNLLASLHRHTNGGA